MKYSKQAGVYLGALVAVIAAINVVLDMGSSLTVPVAEQVDQAAPAVLSKQSTIQAFAENLSANAHHPLSRLFIQLLIVVVACRVSGKVFVRCGLPAVVGEISAGILLGPSLFALVAPAAHGFVFHAESLGTLRLLSQVGICLFMFTVGMELNVGHVRSRAASAIVVSHVSIAFPFLLGVILAFFLFRDLAGSQAGFIGFALFMGISMSITAFPVLARILQERNMARTALGSTAITCAAVDDMTAWSIMALVVAAAKATDLVASAMMLALVLAFVAIMLLGVRRALPLWIGRDQLGREEPSPGTLGVVACVVIAAALCTEVIGIHALFGAFLAGTVMPESMEFRRRVITRVEKFSSVLLLPLFFAFTGLRTEIGLLEGAQDWLICLVIVLVATIGKLGGSALAARMTGMNWRESLQLGALMNTRGLMELVALNIGYDLGILSTRIFTMLVIMAVITTILTAPLLTLFGARRPSVESTQEPSAA